MKFYFARFKAGYRLLELEQAVEYVNTLDWNVYDEDEILVPLSVVEVNFKF